MAEKHHDIMLNETKIIAERHYGFLIFSQDDKHGKYKG